MGYRLSQLYTASSNISHFYLVSVMPMEATGFGTGYLGSEGRMAKNCCLRIVVLEKASESPLDSKEIKPVNLKGDQP